MIVLFILLLILFVFICITVGIAPRMRINKKIDQIVFQEIEARLGAYE